MAVCILLARLNPRADGGNRNRHTHLTVRGSTLKAPVSAITPQGLQREEINAAPVEG